MNKIFIIGGANIDIIGTPYVTLRMNDSNPGKLSITYGGVGRNIAENLSNLNEDVTFVSAIGKDNFSDGLVNHLRKCRINTDYIIRSDAYATSCYLAILDQNKDMLVALSDMDILKEISVNYVERIFSLIDEDDILVVDTNLEEELLDSILEFAPCRVFIDPISCSKVMKIKDHLSYIDTFKPNIYEASELSGIEISKVREIAAYIIDHGVKHLYLSLGSDGLLYKDATKEYIIKAASNEIKNATGAGDACIAAIVSCTLNKMDIKEILKFATTMSLMTLECETSVDVSLTKERIMERVAQLTFEWR